jgi:hypothetical protein
LVFVTTLLPLSSSSAFIPPRMAGPSARRSIIT